MADLVTLDGIQQVSRRPLTSDEVGMVQGWFPLLSAILRSRVPNIDARVAAGDLDALVVAYVASEMLINRFESPAFGVTQHSQTVGPISESKSFDKNAPAGLVLTAELLALLRPVPSGDGGVGTIRLGLDREYGEPERLRPFIPVPASAAPTEIVVNINGGLV